MQINELPTIPQAPADADVMAIEVNGVTYKVNKQALASAILGQIGAGSLSASPSILTNLESNSAANVMQASPRPGVTGTLPPANGGTGQTSLQATRNAMGLGNTLLALPIPNGGTGATTAAGARTALGVDYTVYDSVTDLGLTSGSATILDAFNAMGANAILVCLAGEFTSSEVPNTFGTVEIVRSYDIGRAYLHFYGKDGNRMDWRMYQAATTYNGNNGNLPSGDWVCLTPRRYEYSFSVSASGATIGSRIDINTFDLSTLGITRTDVKGLFISGIQTNSAQAHAMPFVSNNSNRVYTAVYAASATVDITVYVTIIY